MDNLGSRERSQKIAVTPAQTRSKRQRTDGASTRFAILEAARRRLCQTGYAQLNLRDIARDAGINHGLINYHFRGKQQLVMAVLDEANKKLLERQTQMYASAKSPSEKWQQACDFYEDDLKSGFVRVLMELMGASFHDEQLRQEFTPRMLAWLKLIEDAVAEFLRKSDLELSVSAQAISAWIGWFWTGMEASMTLGITEDQGHQREALEAFARLLRSVEAKG